jgi:hypothetical protein
VAKTHKRVKHQKPKAKLLKLDLGCGNNKREGFFGVDRVKFDKVDEVVDLCKRKNGASSDFVPWPWKDNSVEEVHCSHFLEHLKPEERIHFANEIHRILIADGRATIIVPHWCSNRAYGDLTHQWPPVSEMWFYYLSKGWRAANAPHNDFYTCDFDFTAGYSMHPSLLPRNQEYQQQALNFFKEAAQDIIATVVAKK